ncbi:RagB/SusD family nutrient uptake outer membrane protein [Pseudoflavitalea sp. G-6-1-2]|uniref:RagB/SusD family nutrient uptake outer membrane protein n=1 Tax=Pseudoflavitalea sp. G-6-1-2 TaxID=2728841 RepID=UPI00146F4A17|nr:RagB/SusD family nutrient uptake outer membrane protein [Pseudoflavitalea sp. G-6-1-2]NML21750.1 RagB/SusD family nutrient uptake outer membrane protein [Pseudoflavitalea sp. G-6-1-2]
MKLKTIIYAAAAVILILQTGCKKWLDVQPKTLISEKAQFSTEAGFKDAMLGVYIKLADQRTYGRNLTFGFIDVVGQCYNIQTTDENYAQAVKFNYMDVKTRPYVDSIWYDMYANIANVNQILRHIDSSTVIFTGRMKNQIKGEALAMRAFLHFDLLRLFGTAPVVNGEAKSIPYVTTFEVKVFPALTVNQVIEKCLNDLAQAESLLAEDKSITKTYNSKDLYLSFTRHHMNYWAVKGLEARINLYKGDKPKALEAAKAVIDFQAEYHPFVTLQAASATFNRDYTYSTEHLFAVFHSGLKGLSDFYFMGNAQGSVATFSMADAHMKALFELSNGGSSDIRYNYLILGAGNGFSTIKYSQANIVSTNSESDYLRTLIPLIRLSEMYYIAAEAAPVTADGVAYLNEIRAKRGLVALATNIPATTLDTELRKEIKKECYAEGQNFYYFKRRNAAKIYRIDNGQTSMSPGFYVLPIPDAEKEFGQY